MLNKSMIELKTKYYDQVNEKENFTDLHWTSIVFIYYHYLNADDSMIGELSELIFKNNNNIHSFINQDLSGDDNVLVTSVKLDSIDEIGITDKLKSIDEYIIKLYNGEKSDTLVPLRNSMVEHLNIGESYLKIILLVDNKMSNNDYNYIRTLVNKYESKVPEVEFVILFKEEIEEIIIDVENPVFSIPKSKFKMASEQLISHGDEKSLIIEISAKSLKEIYLKYNNKGLFSSNLRYYVRSKNIDESIKETIVKHPESFWYFNNGIIVTCSDYTIENGFIELYNFSIVNGGQTTNLIGNTDFDNDFSIVCKVIKNKFDNDNENIEFLSKVAETSNTQKPIRAKDLIANRVEQRSLRKQLSEVGIYLQIKRGEKINKKIYKEAWQNAKNDELGQILFSFMYQHPGIARNSKSKMLENRLYYNMIYTNTYNTFTLTALQHFKVGYNSWKKRITKEDTSSNKVNLSKYSMFMMLAIFGLLIKLYYNEVLHDYLISLPEDFGFENDLDLKNMLSQNDIGGSPIFKEPSLLSDKNSYHLYEHLFNHYLEPAYIDHKLRHSYSAYATFTKNDTNYYRFVIKVIREKIDYSNKFISAYLLEDKPNIIMSIQEAINNIDLPGLGEELREYRTYKFRESNGAIKAYEVFTNLQMTNLVNKKPSTLEELQSDAKMKKSSIALYGQDILNIINKYRI